MGQLMRMRAKIISLPALYIIHVHARDFVFQHSKLCSFQIEGRVSEYGMNDVLFRDDRTRLRRPLALFVVIFVLLCVCVCVRVCVCVCACVCVHSCMCAHVYLSTECVPNILACQDAAALQVCDASLPCLYLHVCRISTFQPLSEYILVAIIQCSNKPYSTDCFRSFLLLILKVA